MWSSQSTEASTAKTGESTSTKAPSIKSVVNVPPRAASSHSEEGVPLAALDECWDGKDEDEPSDQFRHCWMEQSSQ